MGSGRSPKRRVRDDDFIVGYRRISSDYRRISSDYRRISSNRLSIGGSIQGVSAEILSFKISWQAQYLVRLEGDFTCSTHWKWRFICDADHWWHSFCVAGAVFGEVPGWFCLLRALEMMIHMWRRSLMTFIWCGRRSIWWSWRVTWLAARIGNDVSYVTQSTDDIDFVWQVQYLVRLEGHFVWQAQYLLRLACDFSWQAQHFVTFWEIAGTRNVVFYNRKASPRWDREGPRSGGCEMTILSSDIVGLSSDILESSFYWRKHSGSIRWNLELQDFVAGAVFGEVGGWLYLLHALEMTFHMWRRSLMTFILRGRRSIWWGSRLILLAARIGHDDSYVTQIIDDDIPPKNEYICCHLPICTPNNVPEV